MSAKICERYAVFPLGVEMQQMEKVKHSVSMRTNIVKSLYLTKRDSSAFLKQHQDRWLWKNAAWRQYQIAHFGSISQVTISRSYSRAQVSR